MGLKFIIGRGVSRLKQSIEYAAGYAVTELSGRRRESCRYLRSVKNKYDGQRCFIIGNGPSLKASDLDMLKNEVTFAANRIYNIFPETDWRPAYYLVFDEGIARSKGVCEKINSFDCEMRFFREEGWLSTRRVKDPKCYIHSRYSRRYLKKPDFSADLEKCIFTIATVTYSAIELAAYMGFKEIYLIGMDNKYARTLNKDGTVTEDKTVRSYFGNDAESERTALCAAGETDIAYSFAERYSRSHDFRIYNATRGGYLEVFERVSLDVIMKSERENKDENSRSDTRKV